MADVPILDKKPTAREIAHRLIKRDRSSKEVATLLVDGKYFTDWTSVRVESRVSQTHPIFQFEATEETPVPLKRVALQFRPSQEVDVFLGGVQALHGHIVERHVAYDARQHAIRLVGKGDTADMVDSTPPLSVLKEDHDGKNWLQLAQDLSKHLGIKIIPVGDIDLTPFQRIGLQPGESIMNIVERHARMRNIVIGSNSTGGLLGIGQNRNIPLGELIEGIHILRANAVVRHGNLFEQIDIVGQNPGGSGGTGGAVAREQVATRFGSHPRPRKMVIPAEISDGQHGLERRADMELVFTEGTEIEANITVQGWFKNNNTLDAIWRANESYVVNSPSLMMDGLVLGCSACVYEQSEAGTTTTLTMVDPIHLNKGIDISEAVERRRIDRYREWYGAAAGTGIIGSR